MSRKCDILHKTNQSGNNVSHANNKTKRKFLPNMQTATFFSDILSKNFKLKASAKGVKTIDFHGGLDNFILSRKVNTITGELKIIYKLLKAKVTKDQILDIKKDAKRGIIPFIQSKAVSTSA